LLHEHKLKVEELQKIRKVIHAPWFKKRLSPDEQVMAYRQYNLTRDLVNVLDERIELFRVDNPKPGK
jgi:chorismate mutase